MAGGSKERSRGLAACSWVLYDLADTIFSISILSFFFPVWLGGEIGRVLRVPDVRPETTVEEYAPPMQGKRALGGARRGMGT